LAAKSTTSPLDTRVLLDTVGYPWARKGYQAPTEGILTKSETVRSYGVRREHFRASTERKPVKRVAHESVPGPRFSPLAFSFLAKEISENEANCPFVFNTDTRKRTQTNPIFWLFLVGLMLGAEVRVF
jgi:hypothetical protein